ncbi:MAG: urease accessory protein UreD [Burkholderiales bacterium]|nr:urease accessory protein UreD [Burkholderiales bacterium]
MRLDEPVAASSWRAELALGYARRGARSVLAARRHDGPLVVQKPFYPEGDAVCHTVVVHPPGGIAGGDELDLDVTIGAGAHALLTTPGAAKWYRSAGPWAAQRLAFEVAPRGVLEWLPQETIVFDAARARLSSEVRLAADARFIGWELLCFGRSGSGERFARGVCRLSNAILREGRRLWLERGRIDGGGALLDAPAGLGGQPVCGTLVAAAPAIDAALLAACRRHAPLRGEGAVTRLPGLLVARYLGDSSEAARRYFVALWRELRPALVGREAIEPRIWST